jgi:hypothetical protein
MTNVLDRQGLLALIATLAGLPTTDVVFDPDPNPAMVSPESQVKVTLTLFGLAALGVDEHRLAFNPGGYPTNTLVTTEIGNRDLTVNVMVEAFDQGIEAAEIIDRIRTGIRADASTAVLNGLNLAFVWATKTTRIRTTREQRETSVATMDLMLAGIAQQVSAVQTGFGWVDDIDGVPIAQGGGITGSFTE